VSGTEAIPVNDLIARLSGQDSRVELDGHEESYDQLRRRIDELGHTVLRFPGTRGGTTIGVTIDRDRTDLSDADFEAGRGELRLEGTLTLDYVPLRCIATIDLATRAGTARLVPE
jgi:hypothetical protein